jgi:rubrerythrin
MIKNENYSKFAHLMLQDLKNEKKHMLFYLTAASTVSGVNREEYKELLTEEAQSEMAHVMEFQNAMLGMGLDFTQTNEIFDHNPYEIFYDIRHILNYALKMEEEVVMNYAIRLRDNLDLLEEPEKRWMEIFYEDQLEKSRKDVDNLKMILRLA